MAKSTSSHHLRCTLAASVLTGKPDYTDDVIWLLEAGGNPPALSLSTTCGLRVGGLDLYPGFTRSEGTLIDPDTWFQPPHMVRYTLDTVHVQGKPFTDIILDSTYHVPTSKSVRGRLRLTNTSQTPVSICVDLTVMLDLLGDGQPVATVKKGMAHILQGSSGPLHFVCFVAGEAEPGKTIRPSLASHLTLAPNANRSVNWALVIEQDDDTALEIARRTCAQGWEAEIARSEIASTSRVLTIETPNPEWNDLLAFSQNAALQLFFPASAHLPHPSFVQTRLPDQGYSIKGDGSDYAHLWNGQTAWSAYFLSGLLLPGSIDLVRGLVDNFLHTQAPDGTLDCKPGLAGQRSHLNCPPLIPVLAWKVFHADGNLDWLTSIYPALGRATMRWFKSKHDRDGDGFPEFDNPLQTGLENAPMYDRWAPGAQGVDLRALECPSILAMLSQSFHYLEKMATLLELPEDSERWRLQREKCTQLLNEVWDESAGRFSYRDAISHRSETGSSILRFSGPMTQYLDRIFDQPEHIMIHLYSSEDITRSAKIILHGATEHGEITEEVPVTNFYWVDGHGHATSTKTFTRLAKIESQGLAPYDRVEIDTIDFQADDISLLLPIWGGVLAPDRLRRLVETTLPRFETPHGIACLPVDTPQAQYATELEWLSIPWNSIIIEGLIRSGFKVAGVKLLTKVMDTLAADLTQSGCLHAHYHAQTGSSSGEANHLDGLAPLRPFLLALGLISLKKTRIELSGLSSFSFPITVQYQRMRLQFTQNYTDITFTSGHTVHIDSDRPQVIRFMD